MRRAFLVLVLILWPSTKEAQQIYPAGTAFQENFGNNGVNPQPCWSGGTGSAAQCIQQWYVSSGSGQSIVTAPSGWSGNALELASATTANKLITAGTMPLVPLNSGFTFTMTANLSAYPSSYTELARFRSYWTSGNIEGQIQAYTGGFEFPNGTTCTASANAGHTLKETSNGTTMYGYIDGTQCGSSWADPGYPIGSIEVGGGNGYNTFIQTITLNGTTVTGQWPPSFYVNFNGQYGNSVTASTLQSGTPCNFNAQNANATGDWAVSTLTGISYSYVQGGQPFPSNLSACGGSYTGNVNVALDMNVTTTSGAEGYWGETFYTSYPNLSCGVYIRINPTGTLGASGNIDTLLLGASSDEYNSQYYTGSGTNFVVHFENQQGGGSAPATSTITTNIYYWETFDVTGSGGTNYLWLFNINSSGQVTSLVSQLTEAGTHEAFGGGTFLFRIGKLGSGTISNAADVIYSNVIVSAAMTAGGPLMPPAGAACPVIIGRLCQQESDFAEGRGLLPIFRVGLLDPPVRRPHTITVNWPQ